MASKTFASVFLLLVMSVYGQIRNEFKWRDCMYDDHICKVCECRCKDVDSDIFGITNQQLLVSCENRSISALDDELMAAIDELKHNLTYLDFAHNQLSEVPPGVFRNLAKVRELSLVSNQLTHLSRDAFAGLTSLNAVLLDRNNFKKFPADAFQHEDLGKLRDIFLDNCYITELPGDDFANLGHLHRLWLEENDIRAMPYSALAHLGELRELRLSGNLIQELKPFSFVDNRHLRTLSIKDNVIPYIPDNAFAGLSNLTELHLNGNPLTNSGMKAFNNLPSLQSLKISAVKNLRVIPDFSGTGNLEELSLEHCNISTVPDDFCTTMGNLAILKLFGNKLEAVPSLVGCERLVTLILGSNQIRELGNYSFEGPDLLDLVLKTNLIENIPEHAFHGLHYVEHLDLSDNKITFIHERAFLPLENLQVLNLAMNRFKVLPSAGLSNLLELFTAHNLELNSLPPPEELPMILTIKTSYAYHCCQYQNVKQTSYSEIYDQQWLVGPSQGPDESSHPFNESEWDYYSNLSSSFSDILYPLSVYTGFSWSQFTETINMQPNNVTCMPQPGPFVPCGEIFDSWYLRLGVWSVLFLALFGNSMVLFVNVFSRTKMDVSRFLICNLAAADLMMGVYLAILAVTDITTLGEFQKYGVEWQLSAACKFIGFLGVLSSELSIYTLSVITLERFYTLKYALYSKRLKLRGAVAIMAFGWLFAVAIATLPLVNVSRYITVVCLPMDISDGYSKFLLLFILILNAASFLVIMCCYASIYYSIQGSSAWNSKDSLIAKRMSILVFTDFICWAPIVFFAVTAAFDLELISLYGAKFLTIFIFPINSCANPFLYTLLTKQFKVDCRTLVRKICGPFSRKKRARPSITNGNGNANGNGNFDRAPSPSNEIAYLQQRYDHMPIVEDQGSGQDGGGIMPATPSQSPQDSTENGGCATVVPSPPSYQEGMVFCQEPDIIRRGSGSPLLERHGGSFHPGRFGYPTSVACGRSKSGRRRRRKFTIPFLSWRGDHRFSRNSYSNKDWGDGSASPQNGKQMVRRSVSMSEGMLNAKRLAEADLLRDSSKRGGGDLSTTPELSSSDGGKSAPPGEVSSLTGVNVGGRTWSLQGGAGPSYYASQSSKSPEHRSNRSPIHLCIPRSPLSKKPKEGSLTEGKATNSENTTEFSLTDFEMDSTATQNEAPSSLDQTREEIIMSPTRCSGGGVSGSRTPSETDGIVEPTSSLLWENNNSDPTKRAGSLQRQKWSSDDGGNLSLIHERWDPVDAEEDSSDCSDKLLGNLQQSSYQRRKESLV